ncbi:PREDICTED: uncharacterized protein LOC105995590 [Dipodomys ordii]|uniref:Uncharacterized protein LOC105995590 n=1 Tax=Dipodomys ordii TaxID=10020 RepID=A0A1S3G9V9_DIPOR|nr:PREDICTED: uncharacterized protein LOC105995590 [Dipodomys ordii]
MGVPQRKGLLLLLSVWLGLARAGQDQSQVPVQPGFSPEQAEGHWYTIKLGATNPSAVQEGGAFRCFMTNIRGLENGNLNVTYFHRKDGKCVKEFYIAERTNTPGRYTFEYGGRIYLTFVVLNHDVAIMDLESHSDAGPFIVVELHEVPGRVPGGVCGGLCRAGAASGVGESWGDGEEPQTVTAASLVHSEMRLPGVDAHQHMGHLLGWTPAKSCGFPRSQRQEPALPVTCAFETS